MLVVALFFLMLVFGAPSFMFIVIYIFVGLDIWMCGFIIMTVYRQYIDKERDVKKMLKREAIKTAFATYLFLWGLVTNPGKSLSPIKTDTGKGKELDKGTKEAIEKMAIRLWIWHIVVVVLIIVLFYPPLWLAYQDWKTEKTRSEGGYIELEEHQIRLLDRASMDILDDGIEQDDHDHSKVRI
ncbi:hypothetical protein N0V90_000609 [Kalmusia sp. IMI 367209]|nr:hypothetical protein N0V90_000609 [Kalmusia sp. IMI 367209]